MITSRRFMTSLAGLAALLLGVACVPGEVDYASLRSAAEARQKSAGSALARDHATLRALLARPLTAESAASVALLNNSGIKAQMEELGVAQAELVQARRLPNPTLEGAMRFEDEGRPELEVGAMLDLTDLVLFGFRSGAASAAVDAAKLEAVGSILDLSFDARRAFYEYQAAEALHELRRTVRDTFDASAELATRLREAGNITELALAQQRSSFEEARLETARAAAEATRARERVNTLLGLWGRGVRWTADARLPKLDERPIELAKLESSAVAQSLDLAIAKRRFGAAEQRADAARAAGLLPELKAGVSAERADEWSVGPAVELELPLFYQGQGEIGVANAQMRQQRGVYADVAVAVRAAARATAKELETTREAALHYERVLVPLKQKVVEQSLLEYNAMLIGLFQLLEAKRDQVETSARYVEVLRDYWIARMNAEQLLAGRLPPANGPRSSSMAGTKRVSGDAH